MPTATPMIAAPTMSSVEEDGEGLVGVGGAEGCTGHGDKGVGCKVAAKDGTGGAWEKAAAMVSMSEDK